MDANDPNARTDPPGRDASTWLPAPALAEHLAEEVARAERHLGPLSCLLVVIEDLDTVVERYGDELAEQALAHLAQALRGELRLFDKVGRPSPRELIVLLPGADGPRGEIVARRALQRLRTIKIEVDGHRRPLPITIGLATWREGLTAEALVEQARSAALASRWTQTGDVRAAD
ncbi:MAG TPA: diguanylate cyclase [Solirubrobacteraceae bacterium]|nr:diguanylate cyclase [Solirubrobacteraceae bacterium]